MSLRLEDFFPAYSDFNKSYEKDKFFNIYDTTPETSFYLKKEFQTLPEQEDRPKYPGIPLISQKNISRFLSYRTLNDELLLFHGVGTGKSCTAVNVAELSREVAPNLRPTLLLVKGSALERNFINELAFRCTKGQYIPDNYKNLTKGERIVRLNKLIKENYEIHTFETFVTNIVDKYSDDYLIHNYSNRVIIVDEIHNIRQHVEVGEERIVKKKGEEIRMVDIYGSLFRFFHLIKNRKILLMSGTPMVDTPDEFSSLMNLILPLDNQLPTGKKFMDKYFSQKLINTKELKKIVRGRISYLRPMESNLVKSFAGKLYKNMKHIKIYPSFMKDLQMKSYNKAYNLDTKTISKSNVDIDEKIKEASEGSGLYPNSIQATLFVFPDGSYGEEGYKKYIIEKKGLYELNKELKDVLTNKGTATVNQIIDNIRQCSATYADSIDEIIKHPKELIFVFNRSVKGSGAILFSELLKLVGFTRSRGLEVVQEEKSEIELEIEARLEKSEKKVEIETPRYSIITGETVSETEIDKILENVFNTPQNKYGKYIQVIIGSKLIGEGKSLKNIRQIHIHTPHWNNTETEQAIGRGLRAFSHTDLLPEDKYIKIFRFAAIPQGGVDSLDYRKYLRSEDKDILIKQIERMCKEIAVDCKLNKERNLLKSDEDNSRECDYTTCEYICDNTEASDKDENEIQDTYKLFYAEVEIDAVVTLIKNMFRKKFSYDLIEIESELQDTPKIIILRGLKYIIDNSIPLINRYGFPSFLREDYNLYFLVDEVKLPNSFLLTEYNQYPNIKSYYKFEDIIKIEQYNSLQDKLDIIIDLDPNDEEDRKELITHIETFSPNIKELLLEYAVIGDLEKWKERKNLRKFIRDYFKDSIHKIDNKIISTLRKDEGIMRCLYDNKWEDCKEDIKEEIKEDIETELLNVKLNPYGYYGIKEKHKGKEVFKIMKIEEKKKGKKGSAYWRGAVCITMQPIYKILNIIEDINKNGLNVKPPIDIIMQYRNEFEKAIIKKTSTSEHTKNYTKSVLKKLSDDEIKYLYYWYVKASKQDLCDSLENFFKKENILWKGE